MASAALALALLAVGIGAPACAPRAEEVNGLEVDSAQARFRVEVLAEGLENPWGLAFLPDGRLLITERPGRLRIFADGRLDPRPVDGLPPVTAQGQGGLLDVAAGPEGQWLYLSHSVSGEGGTTTRISRGRLDGQGLTAVETLFEALPRGRTSRHYGSRLAFGPDGMLYFSVGDRGERQRAQDLGNAGGKIHRIHPDGSVPTDNPFVNTAGALPTVWSYGHRNPQGLVWDPATERLWAHEHGPRGGDEVNLIEKGVNYGWPVITYGREYSGGIVGEGLTEQAGMAQPEIYWVPSIAPSGLTLYDGAAFPDWRGDLFVGALALTHLRRLELAPPGAAGPSVVAQEVLLEDTLGRIRAMTTGPDGMLYLITDADDGLLVRLSPV